ncbi:homoserine O-acetyltransferase [Isoptericola jiangsuensis]|uniref:Homoserine O-acetyltransferase n=1 Tax=Isoptericola jiangsuensis TaxID=548579 RepID=A0A2A9EZE5_9MICO|nr:homoserine O-acetyltransferase [Isoptericola jiangsuensis]PFG44414.1 homoserine O-acetyltransferase [Isoptericola jiangsuensis]
MTSPTTRAAGTAPALRAPRGPRRSPAGPVPASGAWREGDPVADRRFADVGTFDLESGARLPDVRVAYETYGELAPDGSNAVLVLHALTGDAHVHGAAGPGQATAGWWESMIGPGAPIDTDRYFVVAPNVLGGCQGTTGPASTAPDGRPWGGRFPRVTTRDQVTVEIELARLLGIESWAAVVGASMGGMRVLEWAILGPEAGIEVRSFAAIATCAQSSGDQIAWAHPQLGAIRADPRWNGGDYYDAADGEGPHAGLAVARQIAHTTYRTAFELDERFGRLPQGGEDPLVDGRYAVQSYLDHHGDKLARRFDANSYLRLTESMMTHDIGRDRGGVEAALAQVTARPLVVAVDSDRLFPPAQSARIAAALGGDVPVRTIASDFGHDGFLIEHDQLGPLVRDLLGEVARADVG